MISHPLMMEICSCIECRLLTSLLLFGAKTGIERGSSLSMRAIIRIMGRWLRFTSTNSISTLTLTNKTSAQ
jgi:hypothetical protein